jgi:hypothetical protein
MRIHFEPMAALSKLDRKGAKIINGLIQKEFANAFKEAMECRLADGRYKG